METTRMKTPVAVFAYNRPDHLDRALDALSKCVDIDACDFYFYSDGPRSEAVRSSVDATRVVLHKWARLFNAKVVEQVENIGLAKSIVTGVTDLCERYGRAVVVEDDLIVSPDFLRYMIQSLDRYENAPRVMQVGGFTISPPEGLSADAFFLPVTTTWGWATWKRAWDKFEWLPKDLDATRGSPEWSELFDLHGAANFSSMLEDRMAGRNDSWGILWWYAVSRSRGLVLYPSRSLVWNGGFDGTGVHCGSDDFLQQGDVSIYANSNLPSLLSLPSVIDYSAANLALLENYFRTQQSNSSVAQKLQNTPSRSLSALVRKFKEKIKRVLF